MGTAARHDADEHADSPGTAPRKRRLKPLVIGIAIVVVVALVATAAVLIVAKGFTEQEKQVRSDWTVETGDMLKRNDELAVTVYDANVDSALRVIRVVPDEQDDDVFTYYDTAVQDRLADAITDIQTCGIEWTAENPLAILNPFGTGTNGLYLYFTTDRPTAVSYTVSAEGTTDFTATARDVSVEAEVEAAVAGKTRTHSFQLIGLVPGKTNHVTLTMTGPAGNVTNTVTFDIAMPAPTSGYPTQLDSVEGTSARAASSGLYALVRTNGYLGYGFFYDNDGAMRYEMATEGLGLDRILFADDDIVVCSSAHGLARIDGLGRVVRTYPLGGYELHHDINYGPDNTVVALAEAPGRTTVEDLVIEVDLETGAVTELVDFSELMADYKDTYTHVIGATDTFFWQAGEWDWIHLNTVEYLPGEDSLIVSSRETSAIIKVTDVHGEPAVSYLIGDESVWNGTAYEDLVYEQVGTFTPQYGQHSVEYDGAGPEEGTYYLLMYNNNYWALSTRDDFEVDLEGTDVSRDLYNGTASYVYRYLVDENAGTYELVASFAVPYSSIVSNVAHAPAGTNYVVNSGIGNTFGEYDESGELIRAFSYTCTLQGYRVFKHDFAGFWFAG